MNQRELEGLIYRARNLSYNQGERFAVVAHYDYGRWAYQIMRASLAAEIRIRKQAERDAHHD